MESVLSSFPASMAVSSCAPMNARTRTTSPTTKVGANTTKAIPTASGIPVLIRLVNSEEEGASTIEIIYVDASVSLFFFDLSGTIRETYILDFDQMIYDETIKVEFLHRVRGEIKFESVDKLTEQIAADVEITREYFSKH